MKVQVFEVSLASSIFYSQQLNAILISSTSELKVDFKNTRGAMESICVKVSKFMTCLLQ